MRVLVVDVGGTHVKVRATGQRKSQKFRSGRAMTPEEMVSSVHKITRRWKYDVLSIGYPGPVRHGMPAAEPHNLAPGWVGYDFEAAFGRPVKIINDAAMQAMGSYKGGKMLFLGFGTGLGSAFIVDGILAATELAHLPYKNGTFEDYVGRPALKQSGMKKWRAHVADVVARLIAALQPDDVVLGGGNAKYLKPLPSGCRLGDNANAILGGFRLWDSSEATSGLSKTSLPQSSQRKGEQTWRSASMPTRKAA